MKKLSYLMLVGLSCLASVPAQGQDTTPRKVALLVGVSDYFNKNMEDLSFAENDVQAVGDELGRLGFETNVLAGRDATREKTEKAIDDLMDTASKMESDGIVLLMFSGHGQQLRTVTDGGVAETPFFCPRDAVPFDDRQHSLRGKTTESVANELSLVSLNRVIEQLDLRSNSRQNLLIVDACRNNPAKGKSAGVTGSTAVNLPQGISILFAARSGQKSWESTDENIKHGVMTHYLLKGLRGDAINRRSQLTWSRLVSHVREEVEYDAGKLAGGADRRQTPHTITNNDAVIVLNDSIVPHFGRVNWVQAEDLAHSVDRFDPAARYVIEFWPASSEQTEVDELTARLAGVARAQQIEGVQVVAVVAENATRIEDLLNLEIGKKSDSDNKETPETVGDRLKGVAICADQTGAIANRYVTETPVNEASVLFLGQSQRRSWKGMWPRFG